MRRAWVLAGVVVLLAAGCLGTSDPTDQVGSTPGNGTDGSNGTADGVETLAASNASSRLLGLAAFDGVPPENVEPLMPGNLTPIECFHPKTEGTVDVAMLFEERSYEAMPFSGDPIRLVGLLGCANRPGDLAREEANEPPWVRLLDWGDGQGYAAFREALGAPTRPANVSMETIPQGFTVAARAGGTTIVEARILGAPAGVPGFSETSCEPSRQDGRSIFAVHEGSWIAFDWNKTEAICPAEGQIRWPEASPLADILGPERSPTFVVDVHVQESRYGWRAVPGATD